MKAKRGGSIILLILVVALSLWGANTSQAQGQVTVSLTSLTINVGNSGTIQGVINCAAGGCGGFDVTIVYDPAVIQVSSAAVGPYLGAGAVPSANAIDNIAGTLRLAAASMGGSTSGNILFEFQVMGVGEGIIVMDFSAITVTGETGGPLIATGVPGRVTVVGEGVPVDTPLDPTWQLVFVSERDGNRELYLINATGDTVIRLTDHPDPDYDPVWSPDGNRIAFVSERDGNPELYLIKADGSGLRRLTDNPAADVDPAWSVDGSQIIFTSNRDGNPELYSMDTDGTNIQRVTNEGTRDAQVAPYPGGGQYALISERNGGAEVYLINTDGTNAQQLTNSFGASCWWPGWAPNGAEMSFTIERSGTGEIYAMDKQGANVRKLSQQPDRVGITDWSPDGQWIAFVSIRDGNSELYVMDSPTGAEQYRLTEEEAEDFAPDWRPLAMSVPCEIRTDRTDVTMHVGPGYNRGIYGYLPSGVGIRVLGQANADDGSPWWKIDHTQVGASAGITSLWVAQADVIAPEECLAPIAEVPPIISYPTPVPTPGTWGPCGSCDTCGYPQSECITTPDGDCVWDYSCRPQIPPPEKTPDDTDNGDDCWRLGTGVAPTPSAGSVSVLTKPNCDGMYKDGTSVSVSASAAQRWAFHHWSGDCPGGSGSANPITITMTQTCTIIANFVQGATAG